MTLHFGALQIAVAAVFAGIALALLAFFALVAVRSRDDLSYEEVAAAGYRWRRPWLAFLAFLLAAVVGTASLATPYAGSAQGRTVVHVTAGQFIWLLDPPSVPPGTRVRFDVTSRDVNHGFGVYDPHGELIGSVQAMPGYTNHLDLTLRAPGTYHIACFEFCGVGHHLMQGTFRVG